MLLFSAFKYGILGSCIIGVAFSHPLERSAVADNDSLKGLRSGNFLQGSTLLSRTHLEVREPTLQEDWAVQQTEV